MRPLRGYICIIPDSWGLGIADSTLSFEKQVPNRDPPDVLFSESAIGRPFRFDSLTIVRVPPVLSLTSFGDLIAECVGLSSNAKIDLLSS